MYYELDKNPFTAIQILSEIDGDMSVFSTDKISSHGLDTAP